MMTLAGAVVVVLGVCALGLVSVRPAPPRPGPAVSATTTATLDASDVPVLSLGSTGVQAPETYLADIQSFGWQDRTRNVLDIRVDTARLVSSVDARTGAPRGESGAASLSERVVGQRVLAVVDPVAARDVRAPGPAVVQMVVVPERDTMQVSISRVMAETERARIGLVTNAEPAGAPIVTALSTHAAGAGARVVMTGSGFGDVQGDGWPTVCGVRAETVSWSDTSVTFVVPAGLERAGYAGVIARGVTSNGQYFTPFNTPVLDSVTPNEGGAGSPVVFEGHDFGATQGDGWVSFAGASGHVVSWSDTKVVAVVPKDAISGYAGVVRHGLSSNGQLFAPYGYPTVTRLSTTQSISGGLVTIEGSGFGPAPGEAIFGGVAQNVVSWSNTQVTFKAPSTAGAGYVGVRRTGGLTSNGIFLTVGPRLTSLSRWWAPPGAELEITGVGFGATQGMQRATIAREPAEVLSWSPTNVRVKVPATARTGYVGIGIPPGTSNGLYLAVTTQAHVDAVDKRIVAAGDKIVVTGSDFGASPDTAKVTIAATSECTIESWTDTRIVATVPAGAVSGYLGVIKQRVASNGIWMTVR